VKTTTTKPKKTPATRKVATMIETIVESQTRHEVVAFRETGAPNRGEGFVITIAGIEYQVTVTALPSPTPPKSLRQYEAEQRAAKRAK
jgi:hypothetical protein